MRAAGLALMLAVLAPAAPAQQTSVPFGGFSHDATLPVEITSDTLELDQAGGTAVFQGGRMHLGAGGAIVLDSDPAAEYDEMLLKTAALMRAHREHATAPAVTEESTR